MRFRRRALHPLLIASLVAACSGTAGVADDAPPATLEPAPALQTFDGEPFALRPPPDDYCGSTGPTHAVSVDVSNGAIGWITEVPYVRFNAVTVGESMAWFWDMVTRQVGAIDLADGGPRWLWSTSDVIMGMGVVGDSVVVHTNVGTVGLDAATGEERWGYGFDAPATAQRTQFATSPSPTDFDRVSLRLPEPGPYAYVNEDGTVVALDVSDGSVVWRTETTGDFSFSPIVDGDVLFQVEFEGTLWALDPATGEVLWTWESRPGVAISDDIVFGDEAVAVTTTAFLGNPDGIEPPADAAELVVLDRSDGTVVGTRPAVDRYSGVRTVVGDRIYEGDRQHDVIRSVELGAVERPAWTAELLTAGVGPDPSIVATESAVLVFGRYIDPNGETKSRRRLDPDSGELVWSVEDAILLNVAVERDDDFVAGGVLPDGAGVVVRLTGATGERPWAAALPTMPVVAIDDRGDGSVLVIASAGVGEC